MFVDRNEKGEIIARYNTQQYPKQEELTEEQVSQLQAEEDLAKYKKESCKKLESIYDKYQTIFLSNSVKIILPLSLYKDGIMIKDRLVNLCNESRATYWTGFRDLYSLDGKQYQMPKVSSIMLDNLTYRIVQIFTNNKIIFQRFFSNMMSGNSEAEIDSNLLQFKNHSKINYNELKFNLSRLEVSQQFIFNDIVINTDIDLDKLCDEVATQTDSVLSEDYSGGEIEAFRAWYKEIQQYKENGKYKLFVPLD